MICNICGCEKFTGSIDRPYKNCSFCGAMERHRYLAKKFNEMPKKQFRRTLDIAPYSKKIYGEFLRNIGCEKYTGIDKWSDGNPNDKRDVSFADFYTDVIGMENVVGKKRYDLVIMEQVLDEIPDYYSAISSIYEVMDNDSMFLCDVAAINEFDGIQQAGQNNYGNVWKFGDKFLINEFKKVFDDVILEKFVETNWTGHLFICLKK